MFARAILVQPRMVSRLEGLNREVVQRKSEREFLPNPQAAGKGRLVGSSMQRGGGSD